MKYLLAALMTVLPFTAQGEWKLVADSKHCVSTNTIEWGNNNTGDTQLAYANDRFYLAASNKEWKLGTSSNNPGEMDVVVDLDGMRVPASALSTSPDMVVLVLPANERVFNLLLKSSLLTVRDYNNPTKVFYGYYLADMDIAMDQVSQCLKSKRYF